MPISFACPCAHTFRVPDRLAGEPCQCPKCGAVLPAEAGVAGTAGELDPDTVPVPLDPTPAVEPRRRRFREPRTEGEREANRLMAKARRELAEDDERQRRMRVGGWYGLKWWVLRGVVVVSFFAMVLAGLLFILWLIAGRFHYVLAAVVVSGFVAMAEALRRMKGDGL